MKRTTLAMAIFTMVAMLAIAPSARAVDGTLEINQAKVNVGGFPYTISASGSYRLTGSLTAPAGKDGIDVAASHVTIDLNGFSITGPGSGTTSGIKQTSGGSLTVENGTVTGFYVGISLSGGDTVKAVCADNNTTYGIYESGSPVTIENSTANNIAGAGVGIYAFQQAVIKNSIADNIPKGNGILTGGGSMIVGCTANSDYVGISAGAQSVIKGNVAEGDIASGASGIMCGDSCMISNNAVSSDYNGITLTGGGNLIIQNTITNDQYEGINGGGASTGYGQNVFFSNITNVAGGATSMGAGNTNLCGGAAC